MVRPRVLTIAGSDPSGGAGLQADLAVFGAFGCHGMAVVAGLTVQDTRSVHRAEAVSGELVGAQLEAVLADCPPQAAKTGMIGDADAVRAVARSWRRRTEIRLVVDPVVRAGSGSALVGEDAAQATAELLVPIAALVTPNAGEASALTGIDVQDVASAIAAARVLLHLGAGAVLVKGGHLAGATVTDVYLERGGGDPVLHEHPRIVTAGRVHGTGCALSAAIAAGLARRLTLREAVEVAIRYVHEAIRRAHSPGAGALVLDFSVRPDGLPV